MKKVWESRDGMFSVNTDINAQVFALKDHGCNTWFKWQGVAAGSGCKETV